MSESNKKQNFLQGAAWLAIGAVVVKIIGAFYKIPLKLIIGDAGFGYFNTAYDVYSLLLSLATAGLPVAMSRLVSQAAATGQDRQLRRIYKTCRAFFLALGGFATVAMLLFSKQFAQMQGQPNAWIAIICLAPSALMIGLMSSHRGFFQGRGNMRPTAVSQVVEAVIKLVIGLALAYVLLKSTGDLAYAAGGAILGVTISCLFSTVYLSRKFQNDYHNLSNNAEGVTSYRKITKNLLAIAVPITIGAAAMSILNLAETGLYMHNLVDLVGGGQYSPELVEEIQQSIIAGAVTMPSQAELNQSVADNMKGIYNFMYTFYNMPFSIISPIAVSMLPAITEKLTLKDDVGVRKTEESSARVTGLLALPCSIGMALVAEPLVGLFYDGYRQALGTQCLQLLGIAIFIAAAVTYTNSVLQSHNYAYVPVINTFIGAVIRLVLVVVLVANPYIGILGVPIASLLCYLCIFVLNLISIAFLVPQKPRIVRSLLRAFLPAAIMGAFVFGTGYVMENVLYITSSVLLLALPVVIGVVVYLVSVIWCNALTREDCLLLPKGEKIADILHLK